MASMPYVATSLTAKADFEVIPTDGIRKRAVSSSRGTQATIHSATMATQCSLEFLTSAGCQTEETFQDLFPALRDSAANTDEALAEQQGNHTGSGHFHSINTGTVANSREKAQSHEVLHQCGTSELCNNGDSALPVQREVGVKKVSYMCRFCKKVLYRRCNLESHIRLHTGERPFVCKVCEKRFNRKADLLNHESSHSGEKPFVCKLCPKGFANRKALTEHEKRHTEHKNRHTKHKKRHTRERLYSCSTCQMSFAKKYTRDCHELLHTGVKPYACGICKKGFFRKGNMIAHQRVHTGEKPFACEVCQKSFVSKKNVNRHKKLVHSNIKPHECAVCQERFTYKRRMVHHQRQHFQHEQSHVCGVCQKSFARKSTLTHHKKLHCSEIQSKDSAVREMTK